MNIKRLSSTLAIASLIAGGGISLEMTSSFTPIAQQAQAQSAGQAVNTLRGCFLNSPFTATIAFNPTNIRQRPTTNSPVVGQFRTVGERVNFSGINLGEALGGTVNDAWDGKPDNMWYRLDGRGYVASAVVSGYPPKCPTGTVNLWSANYTSNANIFWSAGYAPKPYGDGRNLGNANAKGNCTWYANGRLRELGYRSDLLNRMTGNAGQWATQARSAGISVGTTPQAGSIAQNSGHVAVVESVNSNGTINISESSYSSVPNSPADFLYRTRNNVSRSEFSSYIYVPR
jgi:surface antigen